MERESVHWFTGNKAWPRKPRAPVSSRKSSGARDGCSRAARSTDASKVPHLCILAECSWLHWLLQDPEEGILSPQFVKDCQGCSVFPAEWDMVQYLKPFGNCVYLPMACTQDTEISMILLFSSHTIFWNCWAFGQEIFSLRCWSVFCVLQCVVPSACSYLIVACNGKGLHYPFSLIFLSKDRERLHLIFSWSSTTLHSLVKYDPQHFWSFQSFKTLTFVLPLSSEMDRPLPTVDISEMRAFMHQKTR